MSHCYLLEEHQYRSNFSTLQTMLAEMRDWDFEFSFFRRTRSCNILLLWDNTKRLSKAIYFVANDAFFSHIDLWILNVTYDSQHHSSLPNSST
jgi:hypothetical protein